MHATESKHEAAIEFADKHISLSNEEFWSLAEKQGLKQEDFVEGEDNEETV